MSSQLDLRSRATTRLKGRDQEANGASASQALGVLFELASSPATAPNALALLHELQVHQIELELQDEELRDSRTELEAALARQIELYDHAPVGYFTVDARTVLCELNLSGARMLGLERDALLGRPLDSFLTKRSADWLHTLLARVGQGQAWETCKLELAVPGSQPQVLQASAARDRAGQRFLLALTALGEHEGKSVTR